jgi:hypothetical protein
MITYCCYRMTLIQSGILNGISSDAVTARPLKSDLVYSTSASQIRFITKEWRFSSTLRRRPPPEISDGIEQALKFSTIKTESAKKRRSQLEVHSNLTILTPLLMTLNILMIMSTLLTATPTLTRTWLKTLTKYHPIKSSSNSANAKRSVKL